MVYWLQVDRNSFPGQGWPPLRRCDMLTQEQRKQQALMAWVKAHDWGKSSYLSQDGKTIKGLIEATTNSSKVVDMPADMDIIKAWAGY